MEILGQLWWIVVVTGIVAIAFGIPLRNKRRRERAAAQYKQDRATLAYFFDDFERNGRIAYMSLPSREARLEWLAQHHSEFMETIVRHEPERETDSVVAFYLDVKLLNGVRTFPNREDAIDACRKATIAMSLNEYQELLDKRAEDERKAAAARVAQQRKREAAREEARREAQKEIQRQQSRAKKSAKSHWKSLSKEQQTAFRQAKGVAARKKVLRSQNSTDLPLDTLYHLVMATQFSDINIHYNNAIEYCATVTKHTDSSYSPGRSDDGGRSYTDTYSPVDSGGGYSHHNTDSSHSHSSYSSSSDSSSSSSSSDSSSSSSSSDSSSYSSSSDSSSSCSFG